MTCQAQKALQDHQEVLLLSLLEILSKLVLTQSHATPDSRLNLRFKKATEGWANLADDLRSLADKAYPALQKEARGRLSFNAYLAQL